MKKIVLLVVALMVTVAVHAQFEAGKAYIGASLSGMNLSYSGSESGHLSIEGKGGYMFADNLLALGQIGYDKQKDVPYTMSLGAGARYYIVQNGLYLGAGVNWKHASGYNDVMPTVQVGYAFFINGSVTIEPEIYYEQSFKNHKDYSKIGLRIGLGIYL